MDTVTSTSTASPPNHQNSNFQNDSTGGFNCFTHIKNSSLKILSAIPVDSPLLVLSTTIINLLADELLSALVDSVPGNLRPEEFATNRLHQKNVSSVVFITNLGTKQDEITLNDVEVSQGSGSGFIWDSQGDIVTNYHVIQGASILRVTLADKSIYEANVAGFDQDNDIAVLRIDVPGKKLRPVRIGVSANLLVGQNVYAIGSPFGLCDSLTTGVISGLRREINSTTTGHLMRDVIQTEAAINPGNSGGPLLDSTGKVIGINTLFYSPSSASCGVGFSVPIDTVVGIVDRILNFRRVTRRRSVGQLGVNGVLNRMVRLGRRA